MDTDDFVETIRDENRTALSRLGSSKALYALTGGEMEPDAVTTAAVTLADDAVAVLENWDGEPFAEAADATADHRTSVDGDAEAGESYAVTAALANADGTTERLGAFVGWTLVLEKLTEQCTGFFTGQADPMTASTFREYGGTLADLRGVALEALADADDREAAASAATEVIQAAYEEYVDVLEDLGVNPKPVC